MSCNWGAGEREQESEDQLAHCHQAERDVQNDGVRPVEACDSEIACKQGHLEPQHCEAVHRATDVLDLDIHQHVEVAVMMFNIPC